MIMSPETISLIIGGATEAVKLVQEEMTRLRQNGENTEEQDQAFDAAMEAAFASDAWKPSDE